MSTLTRSWLSTHWYYSMITWSWPQANSLSVWSQCKSKCLCGSESVCEGESVCVDYLEKSVSGSRVFIACRRRWNRSRALTSIVLSPVPLCHHTHKHLYKPVGNGIFVPSPNFIAMATRVAHNILHGSIESAIPENPVRCKHLWSICHTSRLIGDFVQILGSKFWALWA